MEEAPPAPEYTLIVYAPNQREAFQFTESQPFAMLAVGDLINPTVIREPTPEQPTFLYRVTERRHEFHLNEETGQVTQVTEILTELNGRVS